MEFLGFVNFIELMGLMVFRAYMWGLGSLGVMGLSDNVMAWFSTGRTTCDAMEWRTLSRKPSTQNPEP